MPYDANTKILKSCYPDVELLNQNLWEYFVKKLDKYQDRIALTCAKTLKQITYKELKEQSLKWAGYLLNEKRKKQINVVAIYSPQAFEFPIFLLGCAAAGITYTSIVPVFTAEEIANQLRDSGSSILVAPPSLEENARKAIVLTGNDIELIINGKSRHSNTKNFQHIIEGNEFADTKPANCDPDSILNLLYTSGTTGKPKGVASSHKAYVNFLEMDLQNEPIINENGIALSSMPMFHIGGSVGVIYININKGYQIVIDQYQANDHLIKDAIRFKATELALIPTMSKWIARSPLADKEFFKTVKIIRSSGSVNTPEDINRIVQKSSGEIKFQQAYGMTEIGLICRTPLSAINPESIGKLNPNVEAKVVDVNTGKTLEVGEPGELYIRSPYHFSYYMNNPEATRNTKDEDNWVHTGDLVKFDENGYLYFVSRLKELIKVYVQQVSPTEIEETLYEHPSIKDAAVIGIPHPEAGELPKGFLVLHEGKEVEKEEIHKYLNERLAPYKQLKGGIQFVDKLERNQFGKLVRGEIKKLHKPE